MLIGHYAPALVLQRVRPSIPLWVLFIATQAVDVAWGLFVLTGVEHCRIAPGFTESNSLDLYDMPYSHSVVATVLWSVGLALVWRTFRHGRRHRGEGMIIALAVASHFVLDLVVHVPDLPVTSTNGPMLGLGLWRHRELALVVEGALFVVSALAWSLPPRNRGKRRGVVLGAMAAFLVASYYLPAPPTPQLMAISGLATYAACALAACSTNGPRRGTRRECAPAVMTRAASETEKQPASVHA